MTKYIIYADDNNHPGKQIVVKKTKHESEAISFTEDVRNLSRYGCMTIIKADDNGKYTWNSETDVWERTGE